MPISPTWPGVYVQEVPSGVRTITGVGTSIALFVGYTKTGPVDTPLLCTSYTDYVRNYSDDITAGDSARQVRLFFLNGGTQCYVLRVAEGAVPAAVTLNAEDGVSVLTLTARSAGTRGNFIRAAVTYGGSQPEDTFNIELFRWEALTNGTLVARDAEVWRGLSMDPDSGAYAPRVLEANSKLVTAAAPAVPSPAPNARSYAMKQQRFADVFAATATGTPPSNQVLMSIDGSIFVPVSLPTDPAIADRNAYASRLRDQMTTDFGHWGITLDAGVSVGWEGSAPASEYLYVQSTTGNVLVRRAPTADAATVLGWGVDQGGIEVSRFAHRRPAATGATLQSPDFAFFDLLEANTAAALTLDRYDAAGAAVPTTVNAAWDAGTPLLEILGKIRDAVVAGPTPAPGETWPWTSELWGYRLAILPTGTGPDDNRIAHLSWAPPGSPVIRDNVRYYSVGFGGAGFQTGGELGADGQAPKTADFYDHAYDVARRDVDLFNLLVLPRSADPVGVSLEALWPNASVFCQERRAFLLMEPPVAWVGAQKASTDVTALRIGLSKQYAALYHPRIAIQEGRMRTYLGPTGAVAGLMARIDSARGVWKAPAGIEADVRGVVGLAEQFSDVENGVLNPLGINVIRSFPNGIVVWGARTMDGQDDASSEYKYVPVRRLALYLEESLYRGLKWVVFEPNGEPLWAQIRLNVGAFLQGLFRQGAFQGATPQQAYFVKCDAETTTENDRNLGIVNIWVGFAPVKPAEFVVLTLQQMTGQVEV